MTILHWLINLYVRYKDKHKHKKEIKRLKENEKIRQKQENDLRLKLDRFMINLFPQTDSNGNINVTKKNISGIEINLYYYHCRRYSLTIDTVDIYDFEYKTYIISICNMKISIWIKHPEKLSDEYKNTGGVISLKDDDGSHKPVFVEFNRNNEPAKSAIEHLELTLGLNTTVSQRLLAMEYYSENTM